MKATCTNNPEHTQFVTTAHVQQEWVVDPYGNFISEVTTPDTTHEPDPDNIWTCYKCGCQAEVSHG